MARTSAVSAVSRFSCALSSAPVTASIVSLGAPTEIRNRAASDTRPCWPKNPSSATPNSSPGNSDSSA